MEPGYYINHRGNLAIVYPNQKTEVWIDFDIQSWYVFTMNRVYASVFEWEYLGEL